MYLKFPSWEALQTHVRRGKPLFYQSATGLSPVAAHMDGDTLSITLPDDVEPTDGMLVNYRYAVEIAKVEKIM